MYFWTLDIILILGKTYIQYLQINMKQFELSHSSSLESWWSCTTTAIGTPEPQPGDLSCTASSMINCEMYEFFHLEFMDNKVQLKLDHEPKIATHDEWMWNSTMPISFRVIANYQRHFRFTQYVTIYRLSHKVMYSFIFILAHPSLLLSLFTLDPFVIIDFWYSL